METDREAIDDDRNTMENKDQTQARKKQEVGLGEKSRIEELADHLLSLIISFLTVKEAIRTSTLSKRWRSLYLSMGRLNFDGLDMFILYDDEGRPHKCNDKEFVRFVDHFLQRYKHSEIESLSLALAIPLKEYRGTVNRWIKSAIRMGVEDLNLTYLSHHPKLKSFLQYQYYMFSFKILSLPAPTKLKHLHLHNFWIARTVSEPPLHSLETLELDDLWIDERILQCIFSSCVNLKKLLLRRCKYPPILTISVPNISLKCLRILEFNEYFHERKTQEIEVSAAGLTYFEFQNLNLDAANFTFSNFSKLEEIRLDVQLGDQKVDDMFGDFAKDAPQLKRLSLCTKVDDKLEPSIPVTTSILWQVEQLELTLGGVGHCNLLKMIPILVACPLLKKLNLTASQLANNVPSMKITPGKHPFPRLKEVKFHTYYSTSREREFAYYFLENAFALEQMILDTTPRDLYGYKDSRQLPLEQIPLKVASTAAKIIIQTIDFAKMFLGM